MPEAWLDSLSEDWVSQPPSEGSSQLPATAPTHAPSLPRPKPAASRLPRANNNNNNNRLGGGAKNLLSGLLAANSSGILNERSISDRNIPESLRGVPAKPSPGNTSTGTQAKKYLSRRSVSSSSFGGSVIHNTVDHKSASSTSPGKYKAETPEWKRRLVQGDLGYGEQRDLFTSAATGLENIFNPPPTATTHPVTISEAAQDEEAREAPEEQVESADQTPNFDTTVPSSPPGYRDNSTAEIHVNESLSQLLPGEQPEKHPRKTAYRQTDVTTPEDSALHQSAAETDQERGSRANALTDISGLQESSNLLSADSSSQAPSFQAQAEARKFSKASTGSVLRNETFSPILLHKHNGEDGKPNYAPMDLPPNELRKRLDQLRMNQVIVTDPRNIGDAEAATRGQSAISIENTDDYEQAGGFINFRRGGRSADGSFRHRALSPELVGSNTSEMFPEESLQASTPKQFPGSVRTGYSTYRNATPPPLKAPHPSPEKEAEQRARGSSGSPLKLFGPYDTFTNQTLMRRISQFEDQMTDRSRSSGSASVQAGFEDTSRRLNLPKTGPAKGPEKSRNRDSSAFFGEGDLDGYEFQETFEYRGTRVATFGGRVNLGQNPNADDSSKLSAQFGLSHDSSPPAMDDLVINRQRTKSTGAQSTAEAGQRHVTPHSHPNKGRVPETPNHRDTGSDSKRPRASPTKDPTPKRRRTLHKSDISYVGELTEHAADAVHSSHYTMQSAISRNQRSYQDVEAGDMSYSNVLSNRKGFRPRTPSPSQRSVVQKDRNAFVQDATDDSGMGDLVSSSLGSAVRPSPLRPGDQPQEADRKPSIKTEDFLHEANKIMAIIRGGTTTRSGLNSVEESELENRDNQGVLEDSFEESTREPFSRPPSREGAAPLSRANMRQEDPEILERLKKYEERSDIGDIIGSSVRSLGLAQDVIRTLKEAEQQMQDSVAQSAAARRGSEDSEQIISDLSNVRISRAPSMNHMEEPYGTNRSTEGFETQRTTSSAGHSTGRSIPTGSSRGSDIRKTIAPQTVSHLIPDQVGNMVLDRERNVWTKHKIEKSAQTQPARPLNVLPSEASEDDPFADIPDLTVDMTMEMQRLRLQTLQKALSSPQPPRERSSSPAGSPPRSPGRAAMADFVEHSSPQQPRVAPITARGPTLITPAQSPFKMAGALRPQSQEEVEHEIQFDEGRDGPISSGRKRNLTITFSSPVASIIQDVIVDSSGEDQSLQDQSVGDVSTNSIGRGRHSVAGFATGTGGSGRSALASRSRSRGSMKHPSMRGSQRFMPRPVSRIEERDEDDDSEADAPEQHQEKTQELSIIPEDSMIARSNPQSPRQASISFVLRTPGRVPMGHANAAAVLNEYVGNLSLTALSDFTVHNPEPSAMLEASYVVGDTRYVTGQGDKPVMSQSLHELVARLTEFEPFEPYWEDLTELQLNDKRLASLHKLNEFCGKVVRLDVSNNNISSLAGIPSTVRFLKIAHNQLSDLTPWGALMNIQYLDVSNNDIKTLSGLSQLVHLRDLKADNCNLTSLEGLQFHDGLQILRARDNHIESIDLEHCNMASLFELDLAGNDIKTVSHIENLSRLSILNLQRNKLEKLEIMNGKPFSSLRRLELDENSLVSLDITLLPQIKVIHADKNKLQTLSGFNKATRLDSLSLREQMGDKPLDIMSFLDIACEVRKLYLSGNRLERFNPQLDFMNLHLLELANCGIRSLPDNAAELMQNLRKLNLNFNALTNVSCLAHISRLKKLSLAGNRLENAKDVVQVAEKLPNLTELDLRDNPCTLGLYPPSHVVIGAAVGSEAANPFVLAPGDPKRDAAYCRRLDMGTRMHRRLYEIVWIHNTKKLRMLDGLPLDRNLVNLRDDIWNSLLSYDLVVDHDRPRSKKDVVSRGMGETDTAEPQTRGRSQERRNRVVHTAHGDRKSKTVRTDEARCSRTTTITSKVKSASKSSRSIRKVTTVHVQTFEDDDVGEDGRSNAEEQEACQKEATIQSSRGVARTPARHNLTWGAEDTFA
ncbi:hypothetical protein PpBr36_06969 [Pyricularia pennisetigena]|uniref:hypothetical protein n=1 Tax=Pyricularia pennisetigena TaxID=1578925 RepID=UPI001153F706|nr:hypothetical protein PpBr36_06969 [Pyricularia pennisetigena]TLS25058.1 hypothetical protein PpBr36_06969 [Pyricularia pennisetigena]